MSPSAAPATKVTWTYDDYLLFPNDGKRYELIDGALCVTPAPTTTHQTVSKRIQFALMLQVEQRGLGVVFDAPVDLILSKTSTVQPDLVVVRSDRRNIIAERGIEGAPDLVVEIVSPSTESTDRNLKAKLYASYRVPEYWIVDPKAHAIEVFKLGKRGYRRTARFGPGSRVVSNVFDLDLPVDGVFA